MFSFLSPKIISEGIFQNEDFSFCMLILPLIAGTGMLISGIGLLFQVIFNIDLYH